MQDEPSKADPSKLKHRRFQFRLRTLMIAVTLPAVPMGYAGWQAKIVSERWAMRELHRLDVLGTRAFRTLTFRVGDLLAFTQFVETDSLDAV